MGAETGILRPVFTLQSYNAAQNEGDDQPETQFEDNIHKQEKLNIQKLWSTKINIINETAKEWF